MILKLFNREKKNVEGSAKVRVKKDFSSKANGKIIFLLGFLTLLLLILIIKLFYLQVIVSDDYTRVALRQITRTEELTSERGIIYDRNNKELAVNIAAADCYYNMDPDLTTPNDEESDEDFQARVQREHESNAEEIAKITGVDAEELLSKMQGDKVVKLITDVGRNQTLELRDASINRVSLEDKVKRSYPYNNLGSHIIGFVNDQNIGQYGIESEYDSVLSGISGKNFKYRQGGGGRIPLTEQETFAPKAGLFLSLNMDVNIEQYAQDAAREAKERFSAEKVSIIVQDTKTGEILAMANADDYNLNAPRDPQTETQKEEWAMLTDEERSQIWFKNWRNFAVNDLYEPGSTFKLITAAAAIEAGVSWPDKQYNCIGTITDIPGVKIGCTCNIRGYKTLRQAIEQSCNISFVQLGREMGRDLMEKYIRAFGFGERTGVDLPAEEVGKVPSVDRIGPAELATLSYGHGIAVTPIQIVNAVSTIANGGYLNTPHVAENIMDAEGNVIETIKPETKRQVISKSTSDTMCNLMERVVKYGTGKRAAVDGYRVGGKTGTANMVGDNGMYAKGKYVASFVGVAPINDPQITVLVIVKDPKNLTHGGTVAAPYASYVIEKTLTYLKVPRTESINKNNDEDIVRVPDVRNLLLQDAGKMLVTNGLKFNVITEEYSTMSVVRTQSVEPNTYVKKGTIVDLTVQGNENKFVVMPDIIGKTKDEATSILKEMKLEYNAIGDGLVESQSPSAGSRLEPNTEIELKLSQSEVGEDELITKSSDEKPLVKESTGKETTD